GRAREPGAVPDPGPRPGGASLVHAPGSQDCVGVPHPRDLRVPALDGAAGLGRSAGRAALDPRIRRHALFLHGREPLLQPRAQLPMTTAGEARLVLLGWNFRTAALSVRAPVAFSTDEVREVLERIRVTGLVTEGVVVSTCNRSEIYGVADGEGTNDA